MFSIMFFKINNTIVNVNQIVSMNFQQPRERQKAAYEVVLTNHERVYASVEEVKEIIHSFGKIPITSGDET